MGIVNNILWTTIVNEPGKPAEAAAKVVVNFTSDPSKWTIYPVGSIVGQVDASKPQDAKWICVDNVLNAANVTLVFGPFSFIIPAYSRYSYPLTGGNPYVQLSGGTGIVNVWFLQSDRIPDSYDYYTITRTH